MNKLERQGSVIILKRAIELLERMCPVDGSNCAECRVCRREITAMRFNGCPGLAVIDDVREVVRALEAAS